MTEPAERIVTVNLSDPNRGRYDPARVGKPNPNDTEPYPEITDEDREATRAELAELRRRMTLPQAAEGNLRDVQQGVAGLVEGVVRTNLRAAQELFQLANPAAAIELQQRFAREYLDMLMQGTATLVQAVHRATAEAGEPPSAPVHAAEVTAPATPRRTSRQKRSSK